MELEAGLKSSRWFHDPLGPWPTSAAGPAWTGQCLDIFVGEQGLGTRKVACGPFLYMNQRLSEGYIWIDSSIVEEELVACSSAVLPVVQSPVVRLVVVSRLGSDTPIASGTRGLESRRSTSVEVNHLVVDFALSSVPGGRKWVDKKVKGHFDVDQFDDTLVRFHGYLDSGAQLFPSITRWYNKWIGRNLDIGSPDVIIKPVCLRNIRIGKPAVHGGLHVGGVSRYMTRTLSRT